jgi:hypothetical protein
VTAITPINIVALDHKSGNPAFIIAGKKLCHCLSEAAGCDWPVVLHLSAIGGDIPLSPKPAAIIASPGWQEADRVEEPFANTETRWRNYLNTLLATGAPVFICTVFRHIPGRSGSGVPAPILERIRRLNRLVIQLSHDLGVGVIDIDRALAHAGAQKLQTDYRLSGELAAEFVGHVVALTLLSCGFDEVVDPELQEKARHALGGLHDLIARRLSGRAEYCPPGTPLHG